MAPDSTPTLPPHSTEPHPSAPHPSASQAEPAAELSFGERIRRLRAQRFGGHATGAVLGALAGIALSQVLAAVGYG